MDWLSPQPAPSLCVTTNEQYKWALLLHTKNVPYAVCRGKWSWDRLYTYHLVKHIQGGMVQGVKGRSGYCRQSQSALKSSGNGEESEPQRPILRTTCSRFNSIILFSLSAELQTIILLVIAVHFTGNVSAAILHINYSNVWDSVARKLKRVMRRG